MASANELAPATKPAVVRHSKCSRLGRLQATRYSALKKTDVKVHDSNDHYFMYFILSRTDWARN